MPKKLEKDFKLSELQLKILQYLSKVGEEAEGIVWRKTNSSQKCFSKAAGQLIDIEFIGYYSDGGSYLILCITNAGRRYLKEIKKNKTPDTRCKHKDKQNKLMDIFQKEFK
jgi:hypothetical protein